jgi:hypothetical protein
MRPITGEVVFEDDFSSQEGWSLTETIDGSIAFGKDELTLAIGETNIYLFSVRETPVFSNFTLEIMLLYAEIWMSTVFFSGILSVGLCAIHYRATGR